MKTGKEKYTKGLPRSRSQSSLCLSELTLTCIHRGIESGDSIDHTIDYLLHFLQKKEKNLQIFKKYPLSLSVILKF